jgi:prophage regulatory protein
VNVNRIMRRPEVEKTVGLSRSAIYAAMDRGDFPRPIHIGRRAVGWKSVDVEGWLDSRPHSTGW